MKRVAIQGFSGSFHEQAARMFYMENDGEIPEIVECATFEGLYDSVASGEADAAVMAIENTVSGGLLPNFELLRKYDLKIKGEDFLRIERKNSDSFPSPEAYGAYLTEQTAQCEDWFHKALSGGMSLAAERLRLFYTQGAGDAVPPQPEKADRPMLFMPSEMVTLVSPVQPENVR